MYVYICMCMCIYTYIYVHIYIYIYIERERERYDTVLGLLQAGLNNKYTYNNLVYTLIIQKILIIQKKRTNKFCIFNIYTNLVREAVLGLLQALLRKL